MPNSLDHSQKPVFQSPVITPLTGSGEPPKPIRRRKGRAILLHLARISMFVTTLLMIRIHHQRQLNSLAVDFRPTVTLVEAQSCFTEASAIADLPARENSLLILNAGGSPLGYVLQTSPESDSIIGFSRPTNVLLAFDEDDRVVGAEILWSRDTREHLDMILANGRLMAAWKGLTWEELAAHLPNPQSAQVDAVSGATLTSFAIAESVALRLTGDRPTSLRFPEELTIEELNEFFDGLGDALVPSKDVAGLFEVLDGYAEGWSARSGRTAC